MLTNGLGHFNLLMPMVGVGRGRIDKESAVDEPTPSFNPYCKNERANGEINHAYSYTYRFVLQGLEKGQSYLILCLPTPQTSKE